MRLLEVAHCAGANRHVHTCGGRGMPDKGRKLALRLVVGEDRERSLAKMSLRSAIALLNGIMLARRWAYGKCSIKSKGVSALQCPQCGSENPENASFCSLCYTPFGVVGAHMKNDRDPAADEYQRRNIHETRGVSSRTGTHIPGMEVQKGAEIRKVAGVIGIEGITEGQLRQELKQGGRFVVFQYCYSLILVTLKRVSPVYFVRAGDSGILNGLKYSLISMLLGWWGFPWGPVFSVGSIFNNFKGGINVTGEVVKSGKILNPQSLVSGIDFSERKQHSRFARIAAGVAIGLMWVVIFLIIGSLFFD
jgi:hypothetical protein